jgi:hypothetical protein
MSQTIMNVSTTEKPGRPEQVDAGQIRGTVGLAQEALTPRLLDLDTAAAYLSMSPWTIRDLEAAGVLARVRVPLPSGRELRKLLFDKADLDRLVGVWKD